MAGIPKGWEKDSDKLYIHETGVRIQRMTYRGKDGWYLVPLDLDATCIEFEPTNEGRDKAFEAFAKGTGQEKPKKAKPAAKRSPDAPPPGEDEEKDEDAEDAEEDEEKDDDEADQGDD